MNKYLDGFLGSSATIQSGVLGPVVVESVSLTAAVDGDLIVHVGRPFEQAEPLVRIHSECVFGQVLCSDLCDCGEQLDMALARLRAEGHGLLFYLRLDGRGAGLAAKVKATELEVNGVDTYESRLRVGVAPESRDFSGVAAYLRSHGVTQVKILTNNPEKVQPLLDAGISVTIAPLVVPNPSAKVRALYRTKRDKFNHTIPDKQV